MKREVLVEGESCLVGKFQAMGCPCEIVLDTTDPLIGRRLLALAQEEAERLETKYSRYRAGSLLDRLHRAGGAALEMDEETAKLIDYADRSFELSDGLFDVTTGVLRNLWTFDGSVQSVDRKAIERQLALVGWKKVGWARPFLTLPVGMEIDLGGLCKEYAADRILQLLLTREPLSMLVNLGGDIAAWGHRVWTVGVEAVSCAGGVARTLPLSRGGLATSGTTKRFALVDGKQVGHILDPRTGRPVEEAPASITVAARTCTEAGFWSTLAMLQGAGAEAFLKENDMEFWSDRV